MRLLTIYLLIISIVSIVLTVYDKKVSKIAGHRRIPEATLMTVGALGGATLMLVTMRMIRHKTRHAKFMLGLPVLIFIHVAILYLLIFRLNLFSL